MPKETQSFTFDTDLGNAVLTFKNPAQLNQMWGSIALPGGPVGDHGRAFIVAWILHARSRRGRTTGRRQLVEDG